MCLFSFGVVNQCFRTGVSGLVGSPARSPGIRVECLAALELREARHQSRWFAGQAPASKALTRCPPTTTMCRSCGWLRLSPFAAIGCCKVSHAKHRSSADWPPSLVTGWSIRSVHPAESIDHLYTQAGEQVNRRSEQPCRADSGRRRTASSAPPAAPSDASASGSRSGGAGRASRRAVNPRRGCSARPGAVARWTSRWSASRRTSRSNRLTGEPRRRHRTPRPTCGRAVAGEGPARTGHGRCVRRGKAADFVARIGRPASPLTKAIAAQFKAA